MLCYAWHMLCYAWQSLLCNLPHGTRPAVGHRIKLRIHRFRRCRKRFPKKRLPPFVAAHRPSA